jgi:hypothetical protein
LTPLLLVLVKWVLLALKEGNFYVMRDNAEKASTTLPYTSMAAAL